MNLVKKENKKIEKCCQPYCCLGRPGPVGPTGPAGPPFELNDTLTCFCKTQMIHIIEQLIEIYPNNNFIIYTNTWFSVTGKPRYLYKSEEGSNSGLFVVEDEEGTLGSVSINSITAIKPGSGSTYPDSITYLTPEFPLTSGCDTNQITAIHDTVQESSNLITVYTPVLLEIKGNVIKNKYGMIVMISAKDNLPVFISTLNIALIEVPPVI